MTCKTFHKFASGAAFHLLEHMLGINGMEMRLLASPKFNFKGSLGVLHHSLVLTSFKDMKEPIHTRLALGESYSILARQDNVYACGILPERRASEPNFRVKPLRLSASVDEHFRKYVGYIARCEGNFGIKTLKFQNF